MIAVAIVLDAGRRGDLALVRTVSFQFYRRERLGSLVYRRALIRRQLISVYSRCCGSIVARETSCLTGDRLSNERCCCRTGLRPQFQSIWFDSEYVKLEFYVIYYARQADVAYACAANIAHSDAKSRTFVFQWMVFDSLYVINFVRLVKFHLSMSIFIDNVVDRITL